jgi:uridine phosphorylase
MEKQHHLDIFTSVTGKIAFLFGNNDRTVLFTKGIDDADLMKHNLKNSMRSL